MSAKALCVVCLTVLLSSAAWAAGEGDRRTGTDQKAADTLFDRHIDAWTEGTITAINIEDNKFTVRGVKLPFASAYAAMLKDMRDKTEKLSGADKQAKEEEVRRSWADRLNKARTEERDDKEAEFTFNTAPKEGKLAIFQAGEIRNIAWLRHHMQDQKGRPEEGQPTAFDERGDKETPKKEGRMSLKDLKVGERVMVGYDSGVITNDAFAIVKHQPVREGAAGRTPDRAGTERGGQTR